jgi:hypothetical protein
LAKLFSTYASERPFEFLIMHNSAMVISIFLQICQHEVENLNTSEEDSDSSNVLSKIIIAGISSIRSLLRVISDPKILEKEREHRVDKVNLASSTLEIIFNAQHISDLAVLLLHHFLILRQVDLNAWEEDPEEWTLEASGDVVSTSNGLRVLHCHCID